MLFEQEAPDAVPENTVCSEAININTGRSGQVLSDLSVSSLAEHFRPSISCTVDLNSELTGGQSGHLLN